MKRVPPSTLKFDFLGKDSIPYQQEHEVMPEVYKAIGRFCESETPRHTSHLVQRDHQLNWCTRLTLSCVQRKATPQSCSTSSSRNQSTTTSKS